MTVPTETGRFALGDLKLQSGEVLSRLTTDERQRLSGVSAGPERLQFVRETLDRQWFADLPKAYRDAYAARPAEQTALVCGMNLAIVEGLLERLGRLRYAAVCDPAEGRCCVRLVPEGRR